MGGKLLAEAICSKKHSYYQKKQPCGLRRYPDLSAWLPASFILIYPTNSPFLINSILHQISFPGIYSGASLRSLAAGDRFAGQAKRRKNLYLPPIFV